MIKNELEDTRCKAMQLKFINKKISIDDIRSVLIEFKDCSLRYIEMLIPFDAALDMSGFQELSLLNSRLSYVLVYNSNRDDSELIPHNLIVDHCSKDLSSAHACGFINPAYFRSGVRSFTLSMKFNNCLYKKIAITASGEFKNCLYTDRVFGKLGGTSLREIAASASFNELGAIKKDEIDVCRDCEFRYVCSDCRAYTKAGIKSKPSKCNYDPYLAEWV